MHGYRVGLWLFVASLIVVPAPVQAEWIAIEARYQLHPLRMAYIDRSTVHREGHLVTVSTLIDWKVMQGGRLPIHFCSTTFSKQFYCVDKLVRALGATDFSDHMGAGGVIGVESLVGGGHWSPVEPDTLNQGLMEAVCGKRCDPHRRPQLLRPMGVSDVAC